VQRALLNGDDVTGVTVFRLTEELDAGPVLLRVEVPVPVSMTSEELFDILALAGSQIAVQGVLSIFKGNYQFSDQNSEFATYADKLRKEETLVSWQWNSFRVHNVIRAFASSVGAFAFFVGKRLKLWRAIPVGEGGSPGQIIGFIDGDPVVACAEGAVRLLEVQSEGKRRMSGADWACGCRLKAGSVMM
jgi:methionyl-tRNA formyltransferase